jgi:hypothetical protein
MLAQISAAQATLESDIEQLRHAASVGGDGVTLAVAQNQVARLNGLQHRIEHTQGGGLASIRAEVMASVAASQAVAQQARVTAASAHTAERALHEAHAEAHRVTGDFLRDFYERKIFDEHLDFASPEQERAYRDREEARRKAIEEARALGTPEGELRALQLAKEQLLDAGRYGAADSPDYAPMLGRIDDAIKPLEQALFAQPEAKKEAEAAFDSTEAALVPPDIIAVLQAAGARVADQTQTGHGVSLNTARETSAVRTV